MVQNSESTWTRWGLPAAAVVLAALAFSTLRQYALLGFDSYPLILTSRIESWGDLWGTFGERLMDGRYPEGEFYRPLLNLSLALDHALWRLDAVGYQLTGALWFGACAWAVGSLARAATTSRLAQWVAMLAFAFHPMVVEVVPVPARRPELMVLFFLALAMSVQLQPRRFPGRRGFLLAALLALAAMSSKETAFVSPALGAVVGLLIPAEKGIRPRLQALFRGAAPHLLALSVALLARWVVLGTLGGPEGSRIGGAAKTVALFLATPQPPMRQGWLAPLVVAVLAGGAAVALRRGARPPGAARLILLGVSWTVVMTAAYAGAGGLQAWYLLLPVVGWALVLGAAAEVLATSRSGDRLARAAGLAGAAALVALLVWHAGYSPWVRDYPQLRAATQASEHFLDELGSVIEGTPDGSGARMPPMPRWAAAREPPEAPPLYGAAILELYSVQAWAELSYPQRRVRVVPSAAELPAPAPDELVLVLTSYRRGFVSP